MDEQAIDPRYAAQFQRGYDGPVLTPQASAPVHSTRSAPVRLLGGPPESAARVPDPPARVERPVADEEPMDVDEPEPPATPWIEWSLLAVGLLLVAAAALVFWQSANDTRAFVGGYELTEQVFASVRATLPGPLFVAGIVGLAAGVILRALRPRP
jgi:hypothetical protein